MAQSFKITLNIFLPNRDATAPGVACVAPGLATPDVGAANDGPSRPRSSWILGGNGSSAEPGVIPSGYVKIAIENDHL